MKICLVIPPSGFLLDERVFLTLGILKVGAVLKESGHEVDCLDFSGVANYEEAAKDYSGDAEVFAFTATTPQLPAAVRIRRILGGTAILGGPHATLVHAAAHHGNDRAKRALAGLLRNFDTVVAGDGEKAIFAALKMKGVVDADNPLCELWQTSKDFTASPWPDRNLVDVGSYHYSVDSRNALSLVSQLGCLTEDTLVVLSSGNESPIKDIKVGDYVLCFNEETGRLESFPVAQTYRREATDIWEIKWDNGQVIRATGEHPIFTQGGWENSSRIEPGTISAYLPRVRKVFRSSIQETERDVVLKTMPFSMAEGSPKREVVSGGSASAEGTGGGYVSGREARLLHGEAQQLRTLDAGDSGETSSLEARRLESNEAPRGGSQGFGNYQGEIYGVFQEADHGELEEWKNQASLRKENDISESGRGEIGGHFEDGPSAISVVRRRSVLDRAMLVGESEESRLHAPTVAQGNLDAWGILASGRIGDSRSGLLEQRLVSPDGMEQGTADQVSACTDRETPLVWSGITSKRFIGKGTVYNLTVHPGHTYFANRMLVHNCPFECSFCGGRNSAMLRRIRTRPSDSVIDEMLHLHNTYGVTGLMFYDDELNVNRGMVDLMRKIKATGIDWRLRGFVKSELFNDEQAEAMYDAGFRWLLCGFEAAHPKILRNINKKATVEDNTRMLETAHRYGLKVKALMSMGHPAESEETIYAMRDWLIEHKPDDFDITVITVYPGTPYYDNAVDLGSGAYCFETHGDKLYSQDVDFMQEMAFYKGKPGEYSAFVWTDFISRERLAQLRDEVEAEVRAKLGIPYPTGSAAIQFEHSMGQNLPASILRSTKQ